MKVTLNGQIEELPEGITIAQLLERLELPTDLVAVERNQSVVPRRFFAECQLAAGDNIEIVTLVGGG
jgi:thiamine biosynthesis protein ThiS